MLPKENVMNNYEGETEQELNELLSQLTDKKRRHEPAKRKLEKVVADRDMLLNEIAKRRRKYVKEFGEFVTEKEIEVYKLELEEAEAKMVEHLEVLAKVAKYNEYVKEKERYDVQKERIDSLNKDIEVAQKKVTASTQLREKILQAESILLENTLDTINDHAKVYLNSFFPDNPIEVNLKSFKESKTKNTEAKPAINTSVLYRGEETEFEMLSGGEMSRVILAFTLALGEICNTSMLLLDESTASLDQELTSEVFDTIKEHYNNRLVLIVAHQIVTGMFDKVINLEPT